ncbi:MAG TPA: large conductance mechanosensitive channel protein MscL [Thermoanaerobaculia bacterium]|nr:large conductance mechanosensitive channel protein MscL [Thermoanaerobaculia bacterium]
MGLVKEFKEFAIRGSVIDLAVGVVIGAAFGKIVDSFVNDILMPPISFVTGGKDFTNQFVTLRGGDFATLEQAKAAGAVTLNYGLFLNHLIDFAIIAFAIFLFVKKVNAWNRKPAEMETPSMRDCPECLSAIPMGAKRCKFCAVAV